MIVLCIVKCCLYVCSFHFGHLLDCLSNSHTLHTQSFLKQSTWKQFTVDCHSMVKLGFYFIFYSDDIIKMS